MSADAPHPGAALANVLRDGRVIGPWTCLRCRYHLADLKPDDRCPECGDAVSVSLDSTLLRFAPVDTLRCVRVGARTINLSIIVGALLLPVLVFAINMLVGTAWASNSRGSLFRDLITGPLPAFTLIYVMLLWFVRGVFLMTTPFPHESSLPRSAAQLRWTLRAFAILVPLLFAPIAYAIVAEMVMQSTVFDTMHEAIPALLLTSVLATGAALVFGLSLYAWSIGGQTYLRGRPLRTLARAPSWFAILAACTAIFVFALVGPIGAGMSQPVWGFIQWGFASATIAMVVFIALAMLSSLVVVDALRSSIKRDERQARSASKLDEGGAA
jgi:hypothetical protein